eukprot:403346173
MKSFVLIAAIVGSVAAQATVTQWNATTRTCTLANEQSVCGDLAGSCCGTVTTKVGTAAATSTNKCIARNLAEDLPTVSYTTGTTTTTVTYTCLNTTRPASYVGYSRCINETNCASGSCCANLNYTIAGNTRNQTFNGCVPGSTGYTPGTSVAFIFGNPSNLGDITYQATCPASLNQNFYNSLAAQLKGTLTLIAFVVVSFVSLY